MSCIIVIPRSPFTLLLRDMALLSGLICSSFLPSILLLLLLFFSLPLRIGKRAHFFFLQWREVLEKGDYIYVVSCMAHYSKDVTQLQEVCATV